MQVISPNASHYSLVCKRTSNFQKDEMASDNIIHRIDAPGSTSQCSHAKNTTVYKHLQT